MRHKPLFIALIGLALAASAHAQWKWRDARGKLQYSDMPPPAGTPDKDILQRPGGARPAIVVAPVGAAASAAAAVAAAQAASAASQAELDTAARQKRDQDGRAARQQDAERRAAEKRRENCARAQAYLRELHSGSRLTRTNDRGERVFMDERQIAAEMASARDAITSECR
ncbi:MAG: DUF4124 domain-containing protein [Roseateles sp.]|uniref:DUF4124 domain-containing protein n=1 Tax=Roseateles sp. TaxID=1971397 RepID=UPI0039E923F3